ncbi:MAG: N-acetylmannosamine-6-phosphate 2-epimerase [Oscillospiraceae bacterium]|nr:N-acetylmannosamine-6-phosphate 2-epimerase [Oscillospiraceae bacterium]
MENPTLKKIKNGLIVSCQALPQEPLYSSYIMARMAYAAWQGGACGIRANTVQDITEIKKAVNLPIIGIIKKDYADSAIYITPTLQEVDALVKARCDIIALDATKRLRPKGQSLDAFFATVRKRYPAQLFMADCACYEEGMYAAELGFDIIATTMSGYTADTKNESLPNYSMMEKLVQACNKPVIAEGGISTPHQLARAMQTGVHAAVVGSAITRPQEITKRFMEAITF